MEIAIAAGSLRQAYSLLITGIKVEQVPNAVRCCIELVRTCHYDLDDLVKLRNESLPIFASKPAILERLNTIIKNAHNGLLEVARLVEKLQPEAHDETSPETGRLEWLFVDPREFSSQEPLISRQHSSVIAELNFLRQLILLAPLIDGAVPERRQDATQRTEKKQSMIAWDNVGLLDEMLGGAKRVSRQHNPTTTFKLPASTASERPANQTFVDPPPPYSSPKPISTFQVPSILPPAQIANTNLDPLVYNVTVPVSGVTLSTALNSVIPRRSPPSVEAKKRATTFDMDGISFLFGDSKMSSKFDTVPSIQAPHHRHRHSTPISHYPSPHSARPISQPLTKQLGAPQRQRHQPNPNPLQVHGPSKQRIPSTTRLSTIPPELIHRHGNFRPQQQPLLLPPPPAANTSRSSSSGTGPRKEAATQVQQQSSRKNRIVLGNQSYRMQATSYSTCDTPISSTPSGFHNPQPSQATANHATSIQTLQPPGSDLGRRSAPPTPSWISPTSNSVQPTITTTCTQVQSQNTNTSTVHSPPTLSYGLLEQAGSGARGSIPTQQGYAQTLRSVPTYATLREHWDPEYLTTVQQGMNMSTPPVDHSGNIIGALSGRTPLANSLKSQEVPSEVHEMSAVHFEPDPVELP